MISIIIPVYNVENYLRQCLQSVIEQTFTDWECIIVDDGSKDRSGVICDEFAKMDSRFAAIHQENRGVSAARNKGLQVAKGEYICFIDSDDWVSENYLSDMLKGMDEKSVDMVVTGNVLEFSNGTIRTIKSDRLQYLEIKKDFTKVFINHIKLFYGPCSILFKHSILKRDNISFPEHLSLGEDMIFNLLYLNKINLIKLTPQANYHYRVLESNSLMTIYRDDRFFIEYNLWQIRVDFFKRNDMWNKISQDYMYRELWGILYNGVFNKQKPSVRYLKKVLGTKEIDNIKNKKNIFDTSWWIKMLILNRAYVSLYLISIIRQWKLSSTRLN